MTSAEPGTSYSAGRAFLDELAKNYWGPLHSKLRKFPILKANLPSFLVHHDKLVIYIGRSHIGVEYTGTEFDEEPGDIYNIEVTFFDFSTSDQNLLEKIVGFSLDSTTGFSMPLSPYSEDLVYASSSGWSKLSELGWNMFAQEAIYGFNTGIPAPLENVFCRIVNSKFFDANDSGLVTRHIRWLDLFPIFFDDSDAEYDKLSIPMDYWKELAERDAEIEFVVPLDYKYTKLPIINSFIELWGNREKSEPEITRFLAEAEHRFILTMRFGAKAIEAEALCEWQSEIRASIKPDFFIVHTNGYADIVEFKLPDVDKSVVVGQENREQFGSWLNSYIAQTRVYAEYFEDPNNRKWFESKYGFKVYRPRRYLVVGRRTDFEPEVWRAIAADYKDVEILNFDDLVDGVRVQFYQ